MDNITPRTKQPVIRWLYTLIKPRNEWWIDHAPFQRKNNFDFQLGGVEFQHHQHQHTMWWLGNLWTSKKCCPWKKQSDSRFLHTLRIQSPNIGWWLGCKNHLRRKVFTFHAPILSSRTRIYRDTSPPLHQLLPIESSVPFFTNCATPSEESTKPPRDPPARGKVVRFEITKGKVTQKPNKYNSVACSFEYFREFHIFWHVSYGCLRAIFAVRDAILAYMLGKNDNKFNISVGGPGPSKASFSPFTISLYIMNDCNADKHINTQMLHSVSLSHDDFPQ